MRFKSFTAPSMADAMRTIRQELGADAVILSTQDAPGGGLRVIAAAEDGPAAGKAPAAAPSAAAPDVVGAALRRHRVPDELRERLMAQAGDPADAAADLAARLGALFRFEPLAEKRPAPVLLTGPPGVGKTLMTAKLAMRARLSSRPVTVICADAVRAGAYEQLETFTSLLELPLGHAGSPAELRELLDAAPEGSDVFVDGEAINPRSDEERARLTALLDGTAIEPVPVLQAGGDPEETADAARAFAELGARRFIASKIDAARRYGGLLAGAAAGPLAFAEASTSPYAARGLVAVTPLGLARLLLQEPRGASPRPDSRNASA